MFTSLLSHPSIQTGGFKMVLIAHLGKTCDWCPYEKREIWTRRHRHTEHRPHESTGEMLVKSEYIKDCGRPPEIRREGRMFLGAFRGSVALPTPWFGTCRLQSCARRSTCCFRPPSSPQFVVLCYSSHRKLRYSVIKAWRNFKKLYYF